MKYFLKCPQTNEPDMLMTLAWIVTLVCSAKFLFEGVEINIAGHVLSLGHADATTYAAMLAPVLGAHGWKESGKSFRTPKPTGNIDNPDGAGK